MADKINPDAPLTTGKPRMLTKTSVNRKKLLFGEDEGPAKKILKALTSQRPSPLRKLTWKCFASKKTFDTSQEYDHILFMDLLNKFASDPFAEGIYNMSLPPEVIHLA